RSCAWRFSKNGCEKVPAGCAVHEEPPPDISDGRVKNAIKSVESAAASGSDADGFIYKMAGKLISPEMNKAFGRTAVANPKTEIERQLFFGGGTSEVTARHQIACNLQSKEPIDVAKDAWALATGKDKNEQNSDQ